MVVGPTAVVNAVVTGQVAAGLRRGNQVVAGDREPGMRQLDLLDIRPETAVDVQCPFDRLADFRVETVAEVVGADPDSQSVDRFFELLAVGGDGLVDRGPVTAVVSGEDLQQHRGSSNIASERSDLVERTGVGHQPITADPSVGRFQADHSAERGWLADRSTGVAADSQGGETGRDGCRRTSAGTSGDTVELPGGAGGAESRVLGR